MGPALQPPSKIELENFLRRIRGSKPTHDNVDVFCSLYLLSSPSRGRSAKRLSTASCCLRQARDNEWLHFHVPCPFDGTRVATALEIHLENSVRRIHCSNRTQDTIDFVAVHCICLRLLRELIERRIILFGAAQ